MKKIWNYININALLLLAICLIGAGLRFYNLDWDEGYFFHPDERNIAGGVLNLDPANGDYNPNFFAYGTLPIYITRMFSGGDFNKAILSGRALSAFFSVLVIILVYKILSELLYKEGNKRRIKYFALFGALLTAFLPGMIQFAHFATFEVFLTFEYLLIIWLAIKLSKQGGIYYALTGIVLGAAIATKIVSLAILPVLLLAHFIYMWQVKGREFKTPKKILLTFFDPKLLFAIVVTLLFSFLFSPYVVLDYEAFRGAMDYESQVATGLTLDGAAPYIVFYTQQFLETIPFVYQFFKIFPYILGWPLTIVGFVSMIALLFKSARDLIKVAMGKVKSQNLTISIVILVTYAYALFHWSMYVKWTRYMIPMLPMLVILSVVNLSHLYQRYRKQSNLVKYFGLFILIWTLVQGLDYFTFYFKPDPRVAGAEWIKANVADAREVNVLSEVYDMGIIPFNGSFDISKMELFNFYDLDNEYDADIRLDELVDSIDNAEYIIIPSNRVYGTKLRLGERYPYAYEYYTKLFNGDLGFELVQEFRRDTFLESLWYGNVDHSLKDKYYPGFFEADESFRVFDRPSVLVFKRK